jgi:predicted alpha/beta hydrolase family esterase
VLVHGAWADGSSWNGEVARLQRDGYTVDVAPNPLRGLTSDSTYLASYLKTVTGPIILVGHSYGGAVITNAAAGNANVKALVSPAWATIRSYAIYGTRDMVIPPPSWRRWPPAPTRPSSRSREDHTSR